VPFGRLTVRLTGSYAKIQDSSPETAFYRRFASCIDGSKNSAVLPLHRRLRHIKISEPILTCSQGSVQPTPQTSFRFQKSLYSRSVLFQRTNFGSVFPIILDHTIYKTKFRTQASFLFFPFSVRLITLTFPSTFKTLLLFNSVGML
jgi:hypothetical protein